LLVTVLAMSYQGYSCVNVGEQEAASFQVARMEMIERQLRPRGIDDERVLQAMAEIPRQLFVPPAWRSLAYEDGPLPIGEEQTISQPYIVALMSQSLELQGTETVLEIGTGSGYQAAVLSRLAKRVYSIEIIPRLAEEARARLVALGFTNVTVIVGDGNFGWKQESPYDAIIVTAAAPEIPQSLVEQLAADGRMVLPVAVNHEEQHLLRLRKRGETVIREDLGSVRFVPLVGGGRSPDSP
jgi:protein-L-isoaspartate(D-aspartate) O-methyltransferase